jgi:hypothetical protein
VKGYERFHSSTEVLLGLSVMRDNSSGDNSIDGSGTEYLHGDHPRLKLKFGGMLLARRLRQ